MSSFMDKIIERVRRETEENVRRKSVLKMIASGKLTLEEIADYLSLPLEEVKALANKNSTSIKEQV